MLDFPVTDVLGGKTRLAIDDCHNLNGSVDYDGRLIEMSYYNNNHRTGFTTYLANGTPISAAASYGTKRGLKGTKRGQGEYFSKVEQYEKQFTLTPYHLTTPPAEGWRWRGPDAPGGDRGGWVSPDGGESLQPDFGHPKPIGPHVDWNGPNGERQRIFPDGTAEDKKKKKKDCE